MIRSVISALVFSNVFISIGAVCLQQITYQFIGINPQLDLYTLFIFCSTFFIYSVFRLIGIQKDQLYDPDILIAWVRNNRRAIQILSFISLVICVILYVWSFDIHVRFILGIASILSVAYILGFPFIGKLRNIPFGKTLVVALVWSLSTALGPIFYNGIHELSLMSIILLSFGRFLFILGLTIPFDIRDLKFDEKEGLITFANKFGINSTKYIAIVVIGCYSIIHFFFFLSQSLNDLNAQLFNNDNILLISTALISLISIWIISRLDQEKNEYWYTGFLDSMLILHFVLNIFLLKVSI